MRATQAITAAVTEVSSQLQDDGKNTGGEASTSGPSGRRSDLSLQLPSRGLGFGNKNSGKGLLSSQNSLKGSPSSGGLLRGLSFKKKVAPPDGERRFLPNSETNTVPDSPILATLKSALSRQRCASLPFQRASDLSPSTATEVTPASARMPGESHKKNIKQPRIRWKVTMKKFPKKKLYVGSVLMNVNKEIHSKWNAVAKVPLDSYTKNVQFNGSAQKEIRKCEVCGQEVKNLPITLLRVASFAPGNDREEQNNQGTQSRAQSVWQDVMALVLISTACYFFFLEQLLIQDMKTQAHIIAAPFAFTLGLLASIFVVIIAIREYIWTYATLDFALVAVTLHLFYCVLHVKAIDAVFISAVLCFVIAMCLNALYMQYVTLESSGFQER